MRRTIRPPEPAMLDAHAVARRYDITVATVWSWLDKGVLPQPIRFTRGTSRWKLETLKEWEAQKDAERAPRPEWEARQRTKRRESAS